MWWFIFLISLVTIVSARPQQQQQQQSPGNDVELEKQTIVEVKPPEMTTIKTDKKVEASTKEILEKIAEVNKKHGWTPKRQKPNYFQFPFSYFKTKSDVNEDRQRSDFRFPTSPYSNPIFDYLARESQTNSGGGDESPSKFDITTRQSTNSQQLPNAQHGYEMSVIHPNADVTADDVIPGSYVKRKIIHQQTIMVPNPNYFSPQMIPMMSPNLPPNSLPQYVPQVPLMSNIPMTGVQMSQGADVGKEKNLSNLEKQTIDNIRNIVSNSKLQQPVNTPMYFPYQQLPNPNLNVPAQTRYGFMDLNKGSLGQIVLSHPLNDLYALPSASKGRQSWNWPGSGYFPIHIRDPFLQMYNAFTSMVEYGPGAGTVNPCPGRPTRNDLISDFSLREAKTTDSTKDLSQEGRNFENEQASLLTTTESDKDYFSIENIDVGSSEEGHISFVTGSNKDRVGKDAESVKREWEKIKIEGKSASIVLNNNTRTNSRLTGSEKLISPSNTKPQPVISPPKRDPTKQTNEFGMEESDKSEEVISNDGNKKLFSRDNTGSGVFINKLKVRKGGVAIAGPGGIATAGSGGTAIVGPNGVAYTHPDSLAIAGSGTKVVAVDPAINLGDIIKNSTKANRTNYAFPPSRVGKVVAVGPVVYYNRG